MPSVGGGRIEAGPRADPSGGLAGLPWQSAPPGEMWQQVAPGELGPCEQTCREPNATETQGNCSAGRPRAVCAGAGTSAARRAPACLQTTASAGTTGVPTR